jgi:uncharacterized protein (TIGR02996 family)
MTPQKAFLQAIVENPDDDTPRLVYADWLEEHGQAERAEFIRVQCQMFHLPGSPSLMSRSPTLGDVCLTDPRVHFLLRREGELIYAFRRKWVEELPRLDGLTWSAFERGFLVSIEARSWRAFAVNAPDLFAAAPIQDVRLPCGPRSIEQLSQSPHLARLRTLDLSGKSIGSTGLEILTRSPYLNRLRTLVLNSSGVGPMSATVLSGSSTLKALHCLYLVNNLIGDQGAEALANSENLPGLAVLYLNGNQIGDDGARALAQRTGLPNLLWLDLSRNQITETGTAALIDSPRLDGLKRLALWGNPLEGAAAHTLRQRFGDRVTLGRYPPLDPMVRLHFDLHEELASRPG